MSTKKSIAHFNGHDEQALYAIKSLIKERLNPLMMFYIKSHYRTTCDRSTLNFIQKEETWHYSVSLLLIFPDGTNLENETDAALNRQLPENYTVETLNYTLQQATEYLSRHSLFFSWVFRFGILLYQRDGSYEQLELPPINRKQYAYQIKQWYLSPANIADKVNIQLEPIPNYNRHKPNGQIINLKLGAFKVIINKSVEKSP